jgi:hypothetical protein
MPRPMPRLDVAFGQEVKSAIDLTKAGERIRIVSGYGSELYKEWSPLRLEALYELAYLRSFVAWEWFLEATFLRYLCGFASPTHGQATMVSGRPFHRNIQAAETAVLAGQQFMLWHGPQKVVNRCAAHVLNGRHEQVINSRITRIQHFADIRHRVAHDRQDVRNKFDAATMALATRRYPGSRVGSFLRDWVPGSSPRLRWLDHITAELASLAAQIV